MSKPEKITINIKTITPIWTGGIHRNKMEYIKGSSIMGGLRFWAESYFRALGKNVCDITGDGKCIYDEKKEKKICSVCELFGCTGKSRSFILKIIEKSMTEKQGGLIKVPECKNGKPKIPAWYLKNGKIGNNNEVAFQLQLTPAQGKKIDPIILYILKIMLQWGTLGTFDQYGYGVVETPDDLEIVNDLFKDLPDEPTSSDKPALCDFFFFIAKAKEKDLKKYGNKLPFLIRCKVRAELRNKHKNENKLRHFFCGSVKKDKNATKYNIALTSDGILRGWGWFPRKGKFADKRDLCLGILHEKIAKFTDDLKWKEFDSYRDNVNSAKRWPDYLQELNNGSLKKLLGKE